ncbi:MAG: RidA family protein [Candidatus Roseilinea sp.]|uniref:RidA family protein n=1 Tax=Candidatus Roseilinea sp. TaxID=2838777 RepID=UPI00404AD6BB
MPDDTQQFVVCRNRCNKVYATYFPDPKPVRTTVGSQLLGIMVKIDVIAYVGDT